MWYGLVSAATVIVMLVGAFYIFVQTFADKMLKEAQAHLFEAQAKLALEQAAKVASERNLIDAQASMYWTAAGVLRLLATLSVPVLVALMVTVCILSMTLLYIVIKTTPLMVRWFNLKLKRAEQAMEAPQAPVAMPRPQRSISNNAQVVIIKDGRKSVRVERTDDGLFRPLTLPPAKGQNRQISGPTER